VFPSTNPSALPQLRWAVALLNRNNAPDTEVPKEIQDVIDLNGGVDTVENRLIHFLDAPKRSITVADYVVMPEMKIRREPYVRHVSRELPADLAPSQ
jgi:hypothetical protein